MSPRPLDTAPAAWSQYEAVLDRMDGPAAASRRGRAERGRARAPPRRDSLTPPGVERQGIRGPTCGGGSRGGPAPPEVSLTAFLRRVVEVLDRAGVSYTGPSISGRVDHEAGSQCGMAGGPSPGSVTDSHRRSVHRCDGVIRDRRGDPPPGPGRSVPTLAGDPAPVLRPTVPGFVRWERLIESTHGNPTRSSGLSRRFNSEGTQS